MTNYRIEMALRRLNRRLFTVKQGQKSVSPPDFNEVPDNSSETSEIIEQEPDTRTLKEIWEQECDVGISYKTFMQRLRQQKWDLQAALHTPKAR